LEENMLKRTKEEEKIKEKGRTGKDKGKLK
jgi:hypothetical protein